MINVVKEQIYHKRSSCRSCESTRLRPFLQLGAMPLANSFLTTPDEFAQELYVPLDVHYCERCSLVQLLDVVDPAVLFRHYLYVTGTSDTIAAHNAEYARTVVQLLRMNSEDLVIETASNDGSLLLCFQKEGVRTLGIDPARNIADIARARGVETIDDFFDYEKALQIRTDYGPAKAVIGNNVLAHVDDTKNFLAGFRALLSGDGLAILEMPYLGNLLNGLEFDTIYHEHLCYFSVNSLLRLFEAVGMSIIRVDRVPVHGGSLRVYAGLPSHYGSHADSVLERAEFEQNEGFGTFDRYERFGVEVAASRDNLVDLLTCLKMQGRTIAGYGASAKGTVLLNYCDIDTSLVPYTVDKSPLKVGLYTPGTHIPVYPVSTLLERQPDYVLILAWNFADEIVTQQQEYRDRGGRFIVPIPELKII